MPLNLKFRETIGLRPKQRGNRQSNATVPVFSRTPSPLPSGPDEPIVDNVAFHDALQEHLDKLDQVERDAFTKAYQNISAEDLFTKVEELDNAHNSTAASRRCAEPVSRFLRVVEQFMRGVAIGIQSDPAVSALVVGAARITVDTVANVYGDLLDFCRQARLVFVNQEGVEKKFTSIRAFIRVQWEPFEARFGTIDSSLQHHMEVLQHSTQALQFNAIRDTKQKEIVDERRNFLRWLSEINFDGDHDAIFEKRHPGTGNWLIQRVEFQRWFDSQSSSLLWCFGMPGVGKSVLAVKITNKRSVVLEHITSEYALNDKVGIAFAYFKYDSPGLQLPSRIVSTFVKQLCWKKEQIPQNLLDFYRMYWRNDRTPAFDKYKDCFSTLAKSFDQTFLVIDALDECKQDQRERILGFISELADDLPCTKVFVTSRREADITEALISQKTPAIQIEARNVAEDINAFVNDRVEQLVRLKKLRLGDPALKERIIQTLVNRAEGMFLWVNLQLRNLCRQRSDRDMEKELNSLPHGLGETYSRIVRQIDQQPEALQAVAQKALMWVLYAERPLRIEELIDAVAIGEPCGKMSDLHRYSEDVIFEACANLLMKEYAVVRPIHFSVQEYFTKTPRNATSGHISSCFLDSDLAQAQLAKSCVSYLLLDSVANVRHEVFIELVFQVHRNSFFWYSSQFFDRHIRRLREVTQDVRECLDKLLSSGDNALAAILQVRRLRNPYDRPITETAFEPFNSPVNAATVIYATALYDLPHLHEEGKWMNSDPPKYPLHQASRGGSLGAVTLLVGSGLGVDDQDESGVTPIYYSAMSGHESIVQWLLEKGADANMQGGPYGNALQAASFCGHFQIVQRLLENGAEVNAQGGTHGSALQAASCIGHHLAVRLLLENGADVNTQGGAYGSAIQAASFRGDCHVVQLLLENGADVKAQGGKYGSALQAASFRGDRHIVQLLLENGADVNAQSGPYGSALQAASFNGHRHVVQLLLENGADVNAQGEKHGSALQAASSHGHEHVVQLLLENGADVNAQGEKRGSALQAASFRGDRHIVQLLLENGADVNAQGGPYGSALQAASSNGHRHVVQLLLENGADVNAQGGRYGSALQAASRTGDRHIVQLLLESGADVNAQGGMHGSGLQAASWTGDRHIVQLLLESGADVNARGGLFKNALEAARIYGHGDVVQLLLENGAEEPLWLP